MLSQRKSNIDTSTAHNTRRSTRLLSANTRNYSRPAANSQGPKRNTGNTNLDLTKKVANSLEIPQSIDVIAPRYSVLTRAKEAKDIGYGIPNMSAEERDEAESLLLGLYSKIGEGCYALSKYNCTHALAIFKSLPSSQGNTPFVLSRTARAFYESRNLVEVSI
jgi:hypothetical protein